MSSHVYAVATPTGELSLEHVALDADTLDYLQGHVGGPVDVVGNDPIDMWVNDNGLILGLPVNPLATRFAADARGFLEPIVGTVVFARHTPDGDTTGLTDEDVATLTTTARLTGYRITS